MTAGEEVRDAVRHHLEGFWPDNPQEEFAWTLGPIGEPLPGFRVRRIAPVKPTDPWVYVTVGASGATDGDGAEFFILSPSESPRHVETLAMVASFHADARYRLAIGRTVNIGRPWIEGAAADHLLVSLPYPYGPTLEHCGALGRHVQVLWLVPITETEARYVGERGLEALEQLLEQSDVDVISPVRRSLV
ncbi:MAG: suppressor of fused domain protein [Acidimicrobiales bacterium]